MFANRERRHPARFRPRAEVLEDRNLLSCTVVFNSATGLLTITGTNQADHIRIVDSGAATAAGAIKVFCENQLVFSSPAAVNGVSPVKSIDVSTGLGNDSVDYQLTGPLSVAPRAVAVRLQGGNDSFNASLNASLGFGAKLSFDVNGGEGNDKLTATMTGDVLGPFFALPASDLQFTFDGRKDNDVETVNLLGKVDAGAHLGVDLRGFDGNDLMAVNAVGADVSPGATLDIALRGQFGDDREFVNYFGQVKGKLNVLADGGPGDDRIFTQVTLVPGSTGTVNAGENGGPGNDRLTLAVRKLFVLDPVTINAKIDGGPDADTSFATANVTSNCETQFVIP
jgi:hypothetical protein